jgi:hypothetical protein
MLNLSPVFVPQQGVDVVWVEDGWPQGATTVTNGGGQWEWRGPETLPASGQKSVWSRHADGLRQLTIAGGDFVFPVEPRDVLLAYVYLDPTNPPTMVMLQWKAADWEHRAFWGADEFASGTGTPTSKVPIGPLPPLGQWARLEAPADLVGLGGTEVTGVALTLHRGSAGWDHLGKSVPGTVVAWVDDRVPAGAVLGAFGGDEWSWTNGAPSPFSGSAAHVSSRVAALGQHHFVAWREPLKLKPGEALLSYVNLDPANVPAMVMLQWHAGDWEHRAYWGEDRFSFGTPGPWSKRWAGLLPPAGQWARLAVPASLVGLESAQVTGMAWTVYGGKAAWDFAGKLAPATDWVWFDDGLPEGARGGGVNEGWVWRDKEPQPFSGIWAHWSASAADLHQHHFELASEVMEVGADETLVAYVYLDAADPPAMVMLQWHDGTTWEHRAYWGEYQFPYAPPGDGPGARKMGPLPTLGQWVRLEAPAVAVGMEGKVAQGMAFTLSGGSAAWDYAGKAGPDSQVVAPRFRKPEVVAGALRTELVAPAGQQISVEVSGDLRTWRTLKTYVAPASGPLIFVDTEVATPSWRFYRLRVR